jgi:transaldolase
VRPRIDDPVDPTAVEQLVAHFPDFRRAYSEDGLTNDEFDSFPPTVRTLRQFIAACTDLDALVRDVMLPEPA